MEESGGDGAGGDDSNFSHSVAHSRILLARPKMFHDSSNFVFYIVGECISCAADTHLATDLTCKHDT